MISLTANPRYRAGLRADKHTFRKEIEASGFRFAEEITGTGLAENFFFRFTKPE